MIKLLLITTIMTISLFARLNPFETISNTQDLNSSKNVSMLKPIPISKPLTSVDDGLRTVKITAEDDGKKSKQTVIVKEKIVKKVVEKKLSKKELLKQCKIVEKDLPKNSIIKPKVRLKPKKFVAKLYKVLPFLTINSNKDNMVIKSRKKYKLIKFYILQNEKKIVFDFKAHVLTYTKYKKLYAPYFKSYLVGNHPKENFFRVVITVKKSVSRYKVLIINNIATISYLKAK